MNPANSKNQVIGLLHLLQQVLLWLTYWVTKPFFRGRYDPDAWVVAGGEIVGNLHNVGKALEPSITVLFAPDPYYDCDAYTYSLNGPTPAITRLVRLFGGPILLGVLLHRVGGFFYIGDTGFLFHQLDGRANEFRFIKARGKRLVCSFLGTEIRSRRLLLEYARERELDVIVSYDHLLAPERLTDAWEVRRQHLAQSAEHYADEIFNAPVDQMSYLTRSVQPPIYFYPSEQIRRRDAKFEPMDRVKIVHAPSSPIIKGTPLVRAAIKKLQVEGYRFDYVELSGVSHAVVLENLESAHIVLNQFYAFLPGQFGVEALAAHCALVTSADETIEPSLPPGSNQAWVVTSYWQIYDHLKMLLDDVSLIKAYADRGLEWAQTHCEYEVSRRKLRSILGQAGGGSV